MASRVSVGKTAPVPLGQQPATNSLPVVFAEDQPPIPVEEQNQLKSEVSLSLLGIPRAEVALGIFADVNTYDVTPSEWAQFPPENTPSAAGGISSGVEHIPDEAGARLVAPDVSTTVLTSKRFFRYQPGRVSSSTMGVKMNVTKDPYINSEQTEAARMKGAPSLKKWGIFDKFDGYYFEIANGGQKNDFRCVRRTQAIIPSEPAGYSDALSWFNNGGDSIQNPLFNQNTNFGIAGVDPVIIRDGLVYTAAAIYDPSLVYSPASVAAIDVSSDPSGALKNYQPEPGYAVRLATYNGTSWSEVMNTRVHQFPFDQSTTVPIDPKDDSLDSGYIRLDAHCNFYKIISNLNRKNTYEKFPSNIDGLEKPQWGLAPEEDFSSYGSSIRAGSWDPAPDNTNREKKVWHLLVNTQGNVRIANNAIATRNNAVDSDGTTMATRITQAAARKDFSLQSIPNRSISNGNVTLKEWFNICVPKPYRMVYEWRPVRAMFSGDKLDGIESIVRQSDINTAATDSIIGGGAGGAINRPGEIIKTPEGESLTSQSAYKVDFTKVTMWKIEFSWYGAVGAIFLCYVPVSNGEARWVRVHHIRASNQHSVASLGNATLPITYMTHGGVESGLESTDIGNTLVKYGASYYIDGGDKGTVRLLSKSSDFQREVPKGFYDFSPNEWVRTAANKLTYSTLSTHPTYQAGLSGSVAVGLMGAYLNSDSTAQVKWIEHPYLTGTIAISNGTVTGAGTSFESELSPGDVIVANGTSFTIGAVSTDTSASVTPNNVTVTAGTKAFLNTKITLHFSNSSLPASANTGVRLIIPRASRSLLSVRAKDFISNRDGTPVRNRLQIYPIKYGAGVTGGQSGELLTLRAVKNPLLIVTNTNTNLGTLVPAQGSSNVRDPQTTSNLFVNTKNSTIPARVGFATPPTLAEGAYRYGYFLGTTNQSLANQGWTGGSSEPSLFTPILGKLFRTSAGYFFEKYNSFPEDIYIVGLFIPERHLTVNAQGLLTEVPLSNENGVRNTTSSTDQTKWDKLQEDNLVIWEDISRLSGVRVGQDLALTPIAGTGTEILSYYAGRGGYQFDLESYFAYNKEYLSFPLTDEVDIINFFGHYDISGTNVGDVSPSANPFKVNNALTWEEQ